MELTVSYFFFAWKIIFDRDMVPQSLVYEQRINYNNPPFLKKKTIISKKGKNRQGFFVPVPPQGYWDDECVRIGSGTNCCHLFFQSSKKFICHFFGVFEDFPPKLFLQWDNLRTL